MEHLSIDSYLIPGRRVHLIGIGGVSMRPLGLVLQGKGLRVTGSDMNSSVSTSDLVNAGIPVFIGHRAENIIGAECIIRTAAVHNDNPEIQAARAAGIPVFERAQAWGCIMKNYKDAVCVSGTHGKTTTTSMITQIAMAADKDPTVMIGGYLPLLHAGHRVGKSDLIIAESCEYCNSFLNFFPTVAVINNIDADHLDFFKDIEEIKQSFRKFASIVPADGLIIANIDNKNTVDALDGMAYTSFGLTKNADYYAEAFSEDYSSFDVYKRGEKIVHINSGVFGIHNVYNALAAIAVSDYLGIDLNTAADAIHEFHGAGRRFEYKGEYNGAQIFDDYAHHPGELHSLIQAAKTKKANRIICAFQPHTYSRTKALFNEFVEELKTVDIAVLAEIYAARESNTIGISSKDISDLIPNSYYCQSLPEVTECLRSLCNPGDLVITVGAGDIYKAGEDLLRTK